MTRTRDAFEQRWSSSAERVTETVISQPYGTTYIAVVPPDHTLPSTTVQEQCAIAGAIGVFFNGVQPSAGLKYLRGLPYYEVVAGFAVKVFLIVRGGATYDHRLHDLVAEVVTLVSENTAFVDVPWYVYEADRYAARYTDFIEVVQEISNRNGHAREMSSLWTKARTLSTRPPFQADVLEQAYLAISNKKGVRWGGFQATLAA